MQDGMGYVHITVTSVPGEWNTFKAILSMWDHADWIKGSDWREVGK